MPLALGTDTGCSIRLPAAWCGLVGHKPTWGRVPLDGVVPLAPSLDHGGALVRTVEDARLALEVLTGERLPPVGDVHGLRLGVVDVPAVPGVARCADVARRVAERAGLRLRAAQVPLAERQREAYALAQAPEALAWHRSTGRWPRHRELYGSDVRGHLERCEAQTSAQTEQGRRLRERLRAETAALFTTIDLLLLPVAGCGPPTTAEPDTADARRAPGPGPRRRPAVDGAGQPVRAAGLRGPGRARRRRSARRRCRSSGRRAPTPSCSTRRRPWRRGSAAERHRQAGTRSRTGAATGAASGTRVEVPRTSETASTSRSRSSSSLPSPASAIVVMARCRLFVIPLRS